MSLYDDASLIMIPSGVKTGKVYSQKPMDSDGQFTFTRASEATRLVDGVVTKVRTNSILQSNSFDTTWVTYDTSVTGGQSGYDGTNNAWLLTKTAASGNMYQGKSYSGVNTFSIYAKGNTTDWIRLRNTGDYVYFDITNGVVGGNISAISPKITSVGNGWYRCEVAWNGTGTITQVFVADSDGSTSATTGSIYIQNAQLEQGTVATDYIATTTVAVSEGPVANMPRLNSVAGGFPSLLLEPQRTNDLAQSEFFTGAEWDRNSSGLNFSIGYEGVETNAASSPDGTINASRLNFVVQSDKDLGLGESISSASGVTHSFSVWLKGEGTNVGKDVEIRLKRSSGGSYVGVDKSYQLTSAWVKVELDSLTLITANNGVRVIISSNEATNCLIYGTQCEVGSYATSYIPNYGTAAGVTRVNDDFNLLSMSSGVASGATAATLVVELEATQSAVGDAMAFGQDNGGSPLGRGYLYNRGIGFANDWGSSGLVLTDGVSTKIIYRLNTLSSGSFFKDGAKGTDVSGTAWAAIDSLRFRGAYSSFNIKQILLFTTALTDAQCIELTTL